MHLLDVGSATGQLSIRAVQAGFGRVTSSEIRGEQVEQQRLLFECLRDPVYRERIRPVHDTTSADATAFPERYRNDPPDVVCSFGLLYHLANPFQHLVNLRAITRRYAIVYTMTHYHPLATNMWYLTIEHAPWITKAVSSVSWTPHFLEVARLCATVGFESVEICYPEFFRRNFPEMTGAYSRCHRRQAGGANGGAPVRRMAMGPLAEPRLPPVPVHERQSELRGVRVPRVTCSV